jgi:hypothetical protein
MSQGMHTSARTRVEAFGTSLTHTPVFHRVRPELTTEEDPIMGLLPFGRHGLLGQNWGLSACDACERSRSDEFKTVSASDLRCHVPWERVDLAVFSTKCLRAEQADSWVTSKGWL